MEIEFITQARLPTKYGVFQIHTFVHQKKEHIVLTMGKFKKSDIILTRVHSECLTGDSLFSLRCDCGAQLETAMKEIGLRQKGILIYLRQEGRGIGLIEKIKAYNLQDLGADTFDANVKLGHLPDERQYDMLKGVFDYFCIQRIHLMTNNPKKILAIENTRVTIETRIPIQVGANLYNHDYLKVKKEKFDHLFNMKEL